MRLSSHAASAALLSFACIVHAQSDIINETATVCTFNLQTSTGLVQRTDNYDLVIQTNNTLWPTAKLYITPKGVNHMYGPNGDRCGFDPWLQCLNTSATNFDKKYGFYIGQNSSLYYADQSVFWICDNTDPADAGSNNAAPLIYPPMGSGSTAKYTGCKATNLTATSCEDASQYTTKPSAIASPSPTSDTGASKGSSGKTYEVSEFISTVAALMMVGSIMACL